MIKWHPGQYVAIQLNLQQCNKVMLLGIIIMQLIVLFVPTAVEPL